MWFFILKSQGTTCLLEIHSSSVRCSIILWMPSWSWGIIQWMILQRPVKIHHSSSLNASNILLNLQEKHGTNKLRIIVKRGKDKHEELIKQHISISLPCVRTKVCYEELGRNNCRQVCKNHFANTKSPSLYMLCFEGCGERWVWIFKMAEQNLYGNQLHSHLNIVSV